MGYRHNFDWEGTIDNGLIGFFVLVGAILITMLVVMCIEIARVHQALWQSIWMRWLALADAVLLLVLLFGVGLATAPGGGVLAAYLSAWGFLLYVVAIELLALLAARSAAAVNHLEGVGELDTYLNSFTSTEGRQNGRSSLPFGSGV